ncbi:putative phospholipid-transporting ATPase IM [Manis javanica]|nr:putative phospholipid-transporting ATPase IM [Manis javanica]
MTFYRKGHEFLTSSKNLALDITPFHQETAVNIAYACSIFEDEKDGMFIVEDKDDETVWQELRSARNKMKPKSLLESDPVNNYLTMKPKIPFKIPEEVPSGNYGLVINGYSLAHALEGNLELELLRTACMSAHIGVGISGQEGMQAMLNSDYTFSRFHYLQRLLLVHGRWSYNRTCKFLSYFFYKNFAFTLVNLWYAFYSGFSAQDANETWNLRFPELYEPGQHNLYFNKKEFVKCLVHGIYSSFVLFFVPMGTIYNSVCSDGKEISNNQYFSLIVQTSLLWVVTTQVVDRNHHSVRQPLPPPVLTKLKHMSSHCST